MCDPKNQSSPATQHPQTQEQLFRAWTEDALWQAVVAFQGETFYTISGLPFSYTLKRGRNGDYNRELLVSRRRESKTLAWSSVVLAFQNALRMERGTVIGRPKELGDIRGISYIYPLLYRLGVIQVPEMAAEKMNGTENETEKPAGQI